MTRKQLKLRDASTENFLRDFFDLTQNIGSTAQMLNYADGESRSIASFPPYNAYLDEDGRTAHIEIAVAGIPRSDIEVETAKKVLTVKGMNTKSTDNDEDEESNRKYIHKGIARRSFTLFFKLGEFIVDNVGLTDGILHIKLVENIPEEEKPKLFKIE